jgi:hypothetical protein
VQIEVVEEGREGSVCSKGCDGFVVFLCEVENEGNYAEGEETCCYDHNHGQGVGYGSLEECLS